MVDDEPKLRHVWGRMFAAQKDMELVASLDSGAGLLDAVVEFKPDVAVIDLTMPGVRPLDLIRELSHSHPSVRAVIYTGRNELSTIRAAFDAGAWAYMDKLSSPSELLEVLRRVAAGEVVLPPGYSAVG